MKKGFAVLLSVLFLLSGCTQQMNDMNHTEKVLCERGIWVSYSEINRMLDSQKGIKEEFGTLLDNCKSIGIRAVYLHVRAFCDSLYPSELFPLTEKAKAYDFDIFSYMLSECHNAGISVHAWINPYRIRVGDTDWEALPKESPVWRWSETVRKESVLFHEGMYLNPASEEVRRLIIDGIREILADYPVDGIHFDDYFYPTTAAGFDSASYEAYTKTAQIPQSLADWRRSNVNALIEGCHAAIRHASSDCIFSVSPAASIRNNYENLYADIESWMKSGSIDRIIPQVYFGFEYPDEQFRFKNLLSQWESLSGKYPRTELHIGLGCYKIHTEQPADTAEWHSREDIIARQVTLCEERELVKGYLFFSYASLFSDEKRAAAQRESLIQTLKKIGSPDFSGS